MDHQQSTHTPRPKAERKPRVRRDEARIQRKLAAQSRVRIGQHFLYDRPNPVLKGRIVTVLGHESRGNIYVQRLSGKRNALVSPFTLAPAPTLTVTLGPPVAGDPGTRFRPLRVTQGRPA
jgi:hypothetical protein